MLEMVGYSCAVGNGLPSVKEVAMYTDIGSNDEDGVSEAIHRFVLNHADGNASRLVDDQLRTAKA